MRALASRGAVTLALALALAAAPPAHAAPLSAPRAPVPHAETGFPGPHAAQEAQYGYVGGAARHHQPPARGFLPAVNPGPDVRVYGYLAYWDDDLGSVAWDDITDIAIFSAGVNSDGTLFDTWKWDIADDAVAIAAPYGVKVHLCVTDFDPSSLQTLLSSSTNRNRLIDELVDWQATTGADGVNIDFEGLPFAVKTQMVDFTRDLEAAVGEVVLASPSVDWAGAWDYDQLTQYADLFIMGYGYHWGGSSYAGPTDPLYAGAGTVWSGIQSYSLAWTLDDYATYGADPDRVILGLPLYGMGWPVSGNTVPRATLGTGFSVTFENAWDDEAQYGRSFEPDSYTPYTYGGGDQIWYGDEDSVRERIIYARDTAGVAGVGFWALHYDGDDPSFWSMIHDETHFASGTTPGTTSEPGTTTGSGTATTNAASTPSSSGSPTDTQGSNPSSAGYVADAGRPFLAYVGDTIVLSGTGSSGPPGTTLSYRWTQLSGPAVTLSSATDPEPAFRVERAGTHVFELLVGDGTTWSPPARSYLVIVDPELPTRHVRGCGCGSAPGGVGAGAGGLWALLLAGLGARRRTTGERAR